MSTFTIYHNPRCSKSRNTLALLEEHGVKPDIVRYLETPPNSGELKLLLQQLGMRASELLRRGEADYKASGLGHESSEHAVVAAMVKYPKLIERPIVVRGNKAVVGRPPENVLALID